MPAAGARAAAAARCGARVVGAKFAWLDGPVAMPADVACLKVSPAFLARLTESCAEDELIEFFDSAPRSQTCSSCSVDGQIDGGRCSAADEHEGGGMGDDEVDAAGEAAAQGRAGPAPAAHPAEGGRAGRAARQGPAASTAKRAATPRRADVSRDDLHSVFGSFKRDLLDAIGGQLKGPSIRIEQVEETSACSDLISLSVSIAGPGLRLASASSEEVLILAPIDVTCESDGRAFRDRFTTTLRRTSAWCTNFDMLAAVSSSPPDCKITDAMPASSAPELEKRLALAAFLASTGSWPPETVLPPLDGLLPAAQAFARQKYPQYRGAFQGRLAEALRPGAGREDAAGALAAAAAARVAGLPQLAEVCAQLEKAEAVEDYPPTPPPPPRR
ncbi:unnamed protein product [Prorocentrum cordatum]|uniref:Uncharacterized protein n=1 Tax=Prorocentrum cordatum TaxID=2364126 RepID=A0ABN9T6N8_9DINO|nr:unnamed protein product [Polarella glacialis]